MMRSLKGTLYLGVILGTFLVLVIAGTVLYFSVNRHLVHQMDASLADKARTLALSIELKHYGLEVDLEEMRLEEMEEAGSPEYISISSMDGRIIYRSDIFRDITVPVPDTPLAEPRYGYFFIKGAGNLRYIIYSFQPDVDDEEEEDLEDVKADPGIVIDNASLPEDPIVLQLFRDTAELSYFMEIFFFILLGTGLGSIGILSLVVWLAIKRGAQPINELASGIDSIKDDDLTVRLEEAGVLEELTPIVSGMNLFLDRLEGSFNRERGFTSDAAHELRTPLAGLKSTIEVALAKEREGIEYRETLEKSLEIVNQLENLVKNLLALARLESGREKATSNEIQLESLILDSWALCSEDALNKHIETSFDLGNGRMTLVDDKLLSQVLEELFRNAVYYTDEGGSIRINLSHERGETRLRISNTGSKVSAGEGARVFDRFWRGSYSRDDTGMRFGLGLPIVKKIAETMDMQVKVQTEMDGEFVVTLILPS